MAHGVYIIKHTSVGHQKVEYIIIIIFSFLFVRLPCFIDILSHYGKNNDN